MDITTKKIETRHKQEQMEAVLVDGREIGFLTKFKNTRTEKHPWKAYRGIGFAAEFLGAYYGGKGVAIAAIVK